MNKEKNNDRYRSAVNPLDFKINRDSIIDLQITRYLLETIRKQLPKQRIIVSSKPKGKGTNWINELFQSTRVNKNVKQTSNTITRTTPSKLDKKI